MSDTPTALVTGASGGLGAALATRLAGIGFDVGIHFHSNADGAGETAQEIRELGRKAAVFQADLTEFPPCEMLRQEVEAEFGRLDLLVNNTGVYLGRGFLEIAEEEWSTELNSTATATYFATKALLPLLRESRGRIVNIGDGSCDRPGARTHSPAYHIGKTGVWILTRSFAQQEASNGVPVNMVSPGLLETSVGLDSEAEVPAGRWGTFDDVFAAVRFLAVDAPAYLTGSNLVAGGGWNL